MLLLLFPPVITMIKLYKQGLSSFPWCFYPITTSNGNHSTTCNLIRLRQLHFWEWLPYNFYNHNLSLGSYWQGILRKTDWSVKHMEGILFFFSSHFFIVSVPPAPSFYFHRNVLDKKKCSILPSIPEFFGGGFVENGWRESFFWFPESLCLRPVMALLLDGKERCCADISISFLFIKSKWWKHK